MLVTEIVGVEHVETWPSIAGGRFTNLREESVTCLYEGPEAKEAKNLGMSTSGKALSCSSFDRISGSQRVTSCCCRDATST